MNHNYKNGRAREYRMMNKLKADGWDIVFRSAGSHSPIDVIGIKKGHDGIYPSIIFLQSKPKKFSKKKKMEIENDLDWLNNEFMGEFQLLSQIDTQKLKGGKK